MLGHIFFFFLCPLYIDHFFRNLPVVLTKSIYTFAIRQCRYSIFHWLNLFFFSLWPYVCTTQWMEIIRITVSKPQNRFNPTCAITTFQNGVRVREVVRLNLTSNLQSQIVFDACRLVRFKVSFLITSSGTVERKITFLLQICKTFCSRHLVKFEANSSCKWLNESCFFLFAGKICIIKL